MFNTKRVSHLSDFKHLPAFSETICNTNWTELLNVLFTSKFCHFYYRFHHSSKEDTRQHCTCGAVYYCTHSWKTSQHRWKENCIDSFREPLGWVLRRVVPWTVRADSCWPTVERIKQSADKGDTPRTRPAATASLVHKRVTKYDDFTKAGTRRIVHNMIREYRPTT